MSLLGTFLFDQFEGRITFRGFFKKKGLLAVSMLTAVLSVLQAVKENKCKEIRNAS